MTKKHDILLVALFCAFLGSMALGIAFLPKQEISENEKRTLARFPSFSIEKIMDGKWESDFEEYISDHFPARNFFAAADAYYMLYTGRNGSNGVYKGKGGYLFSTPVRQDRDKIEDNLDAVAEFARKTQLETTIMIVPEAGYVMSEKLPAIHEEYGTFSVGGYLKNIDSRHILDITEEFQNIKDNTQLYYKTDHHWTSEGAYIAYRLWAEQNGLKAREKQDYTITKTENFYGTNYSKSALWNVEPDTLEIWEYPVNVTVTVDDKEYNSMFFKNYLEEMDKYPVYLDGNHGLVKIENHDNPSGRKVLVIKDSYAHCFVPFMVENCSQVDMVDLRYYLDSVSKLTEETEYDEVLVLYGMSNLCEANDLSILQ